MTNYSFEEHLHRYAMWTAARAVQRSFTPTDNIKKAINTTDLRSFVQRSSCSPVEFDQLHQKWADELMNSFGSIECSYGRAAKIISIYLKTSVVIPCKGVGALPQIIHPPIDRIFLTNLISDKSSPLNESDRQWLRGISWTKLEKDMYWELVKKFRGYQNFNWRWEYYWSPSAERSDM